MSNERVVMNDLQGLPRILRNKIPVYPIKMRDALDFYEAIAVLNIPKNATNDPDIIQMSYLKFLLLISASKEASYLRDRLLKLLKLIFRTEDVDLMIKIKRERQVENEDGKLELIEEDVYISILEKPDYCFIEGVQYFVIVDGQIELSEFDFSKIKTLISEQNMIDIEDENVNPEFKKAMDEAKEFMAKRGNKPAPLDERLLAYQYEMKLTINDVFDMTLYQFNRSLESISHIKNSDMIQHARFSGMVSFKDDSKLPTWLSAIERSKDNPLLIDADKLKGQMEQTFSG